MPTSHVSRLPTVSSRRPAWAFSAVAASLVAMALALPGTAAASTIEYEPEVGQAGKDVVWVPTPQALVDRMLDMAEVTAEDYVIDLGSGDGRTVITAAQRGATAKGIEYNADMVELAKRNAEAAGVTDRATFEEADLFETDLSDASVITLFLLPSINEKLRPVLLELEPGTRVVSNSFRMGNWEPDETSQVTDEGCTSWCTALLWIVPANVAGNWDMGGQTLVLEQENQMLTGTLSGAPISEAAMNGREIAFTAGDRRYVGTFEAEVLSGTVEGAPGEAWHATRAS